MENIDTNSNILYYDEIMAHLREYFYQEWMGEQGWKTFLDMTFKASGMSIQSLSQDLQAGIANGYSIEEQFDLVKEIIELSKTT